MSVVEIKKSVNKDAIDILKDAIERVESGELVSIAVSGVLKDSGIYTGISSGNNVFTMWAALMYTTNEHYRDNVAQD